MARNKTLLRVDRVLCFVKNELLPAHHRLEAVSNWMRERHADGWHCLCQLKPSGICVVELSEQEQEGWRTRHGLWFNIVIHSKHALRLSRKVQTCMRCGDTRTLELKAPDTAARTLCAECRRLAGPDFPAPTASNRLAWNRRKSRGKEQRRAAARREQ